MNDKRNKAQPVEVDVFDLPLDLFVSIIWKRLCELEDKVKELETQNLTIK